MRERSAAFHSNYLVKYKNSRYSLRSAITAAKTLYGNKLDSDFSISDPRRLWKGIQALTDYKATPGTLRDPRASLPEELNAFYARFEAKTADDVNHPEDDVILQVPVAEVSKTFKRVNASKVARMASPLGSLRRALYSCPTFTQTYSICPSNCPSKCAPVL